MGLLGLSQDSGFVKMHPILHLAPLAMGIVTLHTGAAPYLAATVSSQYMCSFGDTISSFLHLFNSL